MAHFDHLQCNLGRTTTERFHSYGPHEAHTNWANHVRLLFRPIPVIGSCRPRIFPELGLEERSKQISVTELARRSSGRFYGTSGTRKMDRNGPLSNPSPPSNCLCIFNFDPNEPFEKKVRLYVARLLMISGTITFIIEYTLTSSNR